MKYLMFTFCFYCNYFIAQTLSPIQTDRPDQTECPFIVPQKYIQIENGFLVENVSEREQAFSYPSMLLKYGVNDKFELRLISELISVKLGTDVYTGISPITIGFKTILCKENGIIPLTSFIGHITTSKTGYKAFNTSYLAPAFRFTMQHSLSNRFSFGYNLGYEWDGESSNPNFIYTLTTGVSITNKIGGYVEFFGNSQNKIFSENKFDGGFTYLISDDFMIDASGGFDIVNYNHTNFFSLGFSYRFKAIK